MGINIIIKKLGVEKVLIRLIDEGFINPSFKLG